MYKFIQISSIQAYRVKFKNYSKQFFFEKFNIYIYIFIVISFSSNLFDLRLIVPLKLIVPYYYYLRKDYTYIPYFSFFTKSTDLNVQSLYIYMTFNLKKGMFMSQ